MRVGATMLLALIACTGQIGVGPSGDAGQQSGDGNSSTDAAADADLAALPCDSGFSFAPVPLETAFVIEVAYTTTERGWPYVGLAITGPGTALRTDVTVVSGQSPWQWSWLVTVDAGGVWSFTFTADQPTQNVASCQVSVLDTGAPPELPNEGGTCAGRVCGESDGEGGTCTACLMELAQGGACFDPPSPIGPSGPDSWACLDNAGCTNGGSCQIWCPGEPCDMVAHPDGCPQGVEACFVPPGITDYEEACRQCCRSRYHTPTGEYACWDDDYNVCRYPGDCGTGPPILP